MRNRGHVLPYNPKLRGLARALRKSGNLAEVVLWRALKGNALNCEFHRQVPIDEYIVDSFCHERMVAIEIDGSSHDNPETSSGDEAKDKRLAELGVCVLRIPHEDVLKNLNHAIQRIVGCLEQRDGAGESGPGIEC